MASVHPPDPSYGCMLGVVSVSLTALVRRRHLSRADVALHVHLCTFRVWACAPVRVQGAAVAVLREASRPHHILYSRRLFTGLDGSRKEVDLRPAQCSINVTKHQIIKTPSQLISTCIIVHSETAIKGVSLCTPNQLRRLRKPCFTSRIHSLGSCQEGDRQGRSAAVLALLLSRAAAVAAAVAIELGRTARSSGQPSRPPPSKGHDDGCGTCCHSERHSEERVQEQSAYGANCLCPNGREGEAVRN